MPCRCQERRKAIAEAAKTPSVKTISRAATYVGRTLAEDAYRAVAPSRKEVK